jgi:cell division protein FtsN
MGRQRLSARDYKHGGRSRGADLSQYRQFAYGLGTGLAVALGVWLYGQRSLPAEEEVPRPRPVEAVAAEPEAEAAADEYGYHDMLMNFEVVIPEQERDVRRDRTPVAVAQPGAYVIQVGSYRNPAEAERMQAKLTKQGIKADIQKVVVDTDEWYRVRIGPERDLDKLNGTRRTLRAADIDAIIYRVGD